MYLMAVTQRCEFTNPALLSPRKHSFFTALLYPVTHYKEGPHPLCKEVPTAEPWLLPARQLTSKDLRVFQ